MATPDPREPRDLNDWREHAHILPVEVSTWSDYQEPEARRGVHITPPLDYGRFWRALTAYLITRRYLRQPPVIVRDGLFVSHVPGGPVADLLCGAECPDDPDVTCTFLAGHGPIHPRRYVRGPDLEMFAEEVTYEHANLDQGGFWNLDGDLDGDLDGQR
jgi:hypothetical protein